MKRGEKKEDGAKVSPGSIALRLAFLGARGGETYGGKNPLEISARDGVKRRGGNQNEAKNFWGGRHILYAKMRGPRAPRLVTVSMDCF